jgi:hypothetical protein
MKKTRKKQHGHCAIAREYEATAQVSRHRPVHELHPIDK